MASAENASLDTGSLVTLAVAFTLLLPVLPYSLYRLARLLTRSSPPASHLTASLTLATTVALALYATCALVAISGVDPTRSSTVAAGAFGCLVPLLHNITLFILFHVHRPEDLHHATTVRRRVISPAGSSFALLSFLLVSVFCLQAAGLALTRPDQPVRAVNSARAALSILFSCGLGALVLCRIVPFAHPKPPPARDVEIGDSEPNAATSFRRQLSFEIRLFAVLGLSVLVNIFSLAFPLGSPYTRLSLPSGTTEATLPPSIVGSTHTSAVTYLLIALATVAQLILLIELVSTGTRRLRTGDPSTLPRSTTSFDSSFVEISLPPPALPPRPSHFSGHSLVPSTPPSSAMPSMSRISSATSPYTAARSTPSPRSHRSLPPLNITLTRPSLPATYQPHSASRSPIAAPSTTSSIPQSARHSIRRGSSSSSSSPTQLRTGSFAGSRQLRSGSYSSSLRRISASPSATRLSSLFTAAPVSATSPSIGPGSSRRRSSSVGSILRSVVSPGSVVVAPTYAPSIATEWEVEPNEAHDDPFARPPPTPSSAPSTPGPIATPTRADSMHSGGLGGLAANRLVIALEAIEEPENGSPQNLSLEEGHGEALTRPSTPSEGDHVERVLTPLPLDAESGRSRSHSSGSLFREHLFEREPSVIRDQRSFLPSALSARQGSEPSTPTAAGPHRFVPESPPRRRTDRRASSPVRPNISGFPIDRAGDAVHSPAPRTPVLARSRSASARLFSPGKLISIRRIRSSLCRTSGRLRTAELDEHSFERPSESSELSFACQGTPDPNLPRPQPLGLAPPADVRLSVGSRKAWWKHMSTGSHVSSTDDSRIFRDFSQGPTTSLDLPVPPSLLRSSWSSQSIGPPATPRAARIAVAANARWSGYELPILADVSPLSSSLFLPLPRRSGSNKRKSLRRIESSPAMIENACAIPEPTLLSLAAPSSKLSASTFTTARSQIHGHGDVRSTELTLEIEFDERGIVGQTFAPELPDGGTLSSPSSSAPYTPITPSFDSITAPFWSRGDESPFSPLTPVSPGNAACFD